MMCVLAWMSRSYADDMAAFSAHGLDYYPHVCAGVLVGEIFSTFRPGSKSQYDPRAGGEFYQNLIDKAMAAGVDRLFVGMFDEYDEGTAVIR